MLALHDCLERLRKEGTIALDAWPTNTFAPAELGLIARDGELSWHTPPDLLDSSELQARLPDLEVTVCHLIDSTNSELLRTGARVSIHRRLLIAEFQHGGRGRRGRTWLSPYARNLAMSLGMATARRMADLGGLSIVAGLALASAFEHLGVAGVALKWPNDVLVEDRKLAGILVELLQRGSAVEFVVGMGVNVALSDGEIEAIGQPVTDLRRHGVTLDRTELAARLIERVVAHLDHFEAEGFAPFVDAFNALHKFHGQQVQLIQPQGTVLGRAVGVGSGGELLIETDRGVESFHGGEVSLRGAP